MRTPSKHSIALAALVLSRLMIGGATADASDGTTRADAAIRAAEAWTLAQAESPDPSAPHARQPDAQQVMRIAGSPRSYRWGELSSNFLAPDWFPQDHPPAPHVVLFGRKPAWACGACHYPNGEGDTASPALAGLPKAYILEQIEAFRDGQRRPADPSMAEEARSLDDADLQQAADYFSSLKLPAIRRLVETASVPKTHWEEFALAPDKDGAREPMGERIIEVSNDPTLGDWGDERIGYTAYVPPGSIARGAVISAQGNGAVAACESCHGAQLTGQMMRGIGLAPPLAGRSPTYIVKELILFRLGYRTDPAALPMRAEASQLTVPEMVDVAVYAASRKP